MRQLKTSILVVAVGVAFSLFAMIMTWLVLGDASPFREYFLYRVSIPNLIGRLLVLPYFGLVLLNPSPEVENFVGLVLEFIQWFVIGSLLAWLLCRRF